MNASRALAPGVICNRHVVSHNRRIRAPGSRVSMLVPSMCIFVNARTARSSGGKGYSSYFPRESCICLENKKSYRCGFPITLRLARIEVPVASTPCPKMGSLGTEYWQDCNPYLLLFFTYFPNSSRWCRSVRQKKAFLLSLHSVGPSRCSPPVLSSVDPVDPRRRIGLHVHHHRYCARLEKGAMPVINISMVQGLHVIGFPVRCRKTVAHMTVRACRDAMVPCVLPPANNSLVLCCIFAHTSAALEQ